MAERNMIKEGFVKNSLTVSGTVSGTQTVSVSQIDALVDEDFTTTALTISGGEFITLDADLGARWKLDRIEYFTDDTTASGITMGISDNNLEFFAVTMTGSAPKYVGDIQDSTISGAPRFIRLVHSGASDTDVQEWRAINDDTLVDFGSDGTLTEIEIEDSPIGRPSEQVQTLVLFNKFNKPGTGFVFIDNTGTEADEEIQVAANSSGPFFGLTTADGRQPDITPWQLGEFTNTRTAASGTYSVDFKDNKAKGWTATGFISATVSGGIFIGTTSTFTPTFEINEDFVTETKADRDNLLTFHAQDIDRVRVRLRIPTIDPSFVTEGPRLFWTNQKDTGFESAKSTLAITSSQNFNNTIQDYLFEVDDVVTWSGITRGFQIRPFVITSGTGLSLEFHELEAFHSSGQERVALGFLPVNSGTFARLDIDSSTLDSSGTTFISRRAVVTQPSIITKVRSVHSPSTPGDIGDGMFLATVTGTFTLGVNWTVKRVVQFDDQSGDISFLEQDVLWPAEPNDYIGLGLRLFFTTRFEDSNPGDTLRTTATLRLDTVANANADMQNTVSPRNFTEEARNYLFEYEAISAGPHFPAGTYKTPIFDGGEPPALMSVDFESDEPDGTSIDSGGDAFDTLRARASDTPPITTTALGERTGPFYLFNGFTQPNPFSINSENSSVTARDGVQTQNVAGTMFFHKQKEELWVLNLLASGTLLDFRPTWDVFTIDNGDYIRTQSVGGDINYGYNHEDITNVDTIFEPVGFIPDYDREEIYIIQREDAFFVGAGTYYGIVLDLDGNFKEVFWRSDTIGEPVSPARINQIGEIAYDGNFFYALTDDASGGGTERDLLMVIRNGTTLSPRDIAFINEIVIEDLPGLTFAKSNNDPKGIAFNTQNGLLYLYFESTVPGEGGPTTKAPELFTLEISPDDPDTDFATEVTFTLGTISGTSFDSTPDVFGFRLEDAGTNDASHISRRELHFTTMMTYIESRDTFGILQSREAEFSDEFIGPGNIGGSLNASELWDDHTFSFFIEIGAGTASGTATVLPDLANTTDATWGTASGTLEFETITTDSVLFPTGRFGQVEYTLNATPDGLQTPFIERSQVAQGLKVGNIPASGTRDIFLRTDISDDKNIGDQRGRLKVFWQLEE